MLGFGSIRASICGTWVTCESYPGSLVDFPIWIHTYTSENRGGLTWIKYPTKDVGSDFFLCFISYHIILYHISYHMFGFEIDLMC